jgi:hypothetical protein
VNFQHSFLVIGGDLTAQNRFIQCDRQGDVNVIAVAAEQFVRANM